MRTQPTASHRMQNTISTVSHRRLSHRLCMLVLVLAVLPALLLSLAGCGGGSGGAAEAMPPASDGRAQALQASASGALLSYVKDKVRQRATTLASDPGTDVNGPSAAPPLTFNAGPTANTAATVVSASTVQEAGVDEPDFIKSDGTLILSLQPDARTADAITPRLRSHRRQADGTLIAVSTLTVASPPPGSLVSRGLLYADGVRRAAMLAESITISQQGPCTTTECVGGGMTGLPFAAVVSSSVDIQLVSADSAGGLAAGDRLSISGRLVGARKVGNTLVIVSTHMPVVAADKLPSTASAAEREALLAQLRTQDLLPTLRINGGSARALLSDTDCWLQPGNASTGIQFTSITTLDLGTPGAQPASRCIVGGSEALYMSSSTLVLATSRTRYLASNGPSITLYPPAFKTDIHKFAFAGGAVAYRGSGVVDGHLGFDSQRKAQRISEWNGDVRVLSFTGNTGWFGAPSTSTAPSPATLTVLRERSADTTLQELARLPNSVRTAAIGKAGEQVYAVRFAAERAYVVTFRRTDPLYVLDLSNAADPRTAGEVEVAGVSESLFPLPNGLLFGVGRDADANGNMTGLKFSLLDVANPASPRELASTVVGTRFSSSGLDYAMQALNSLQIGSTTRVALPTLLFAGSNALPREPSQQLQRFEVDGSARTLRSRPAVPSSASPGTGLWTERSLQIDNDLYYLSNGELTRWAW